MKIFKVIIKTETLELVNGYPSEYYDVDGKVCFKVKIFEEITEYKVKGSEEAVRNRLKKSNIVSIEYLEDSYNIWDKAAPDDYVSFLGKGKLKTRTYKTEADKQCSPEVQEFYLKDKEAYLNRPLILSEF